MQPNTPDQHTPQLSSTYLDQIAAPQPIKTANPFILWGMIAVVLAVAIGGVMLLSTKSSGPSSSSLASVAAQLASLKDVSDEAQRNVQSSELKTLNSSLKLALSDANREIQAPLSAKKIKSKELLKNKDTKQVVADITALKARLEDARLNGVYDRTYAREMAYSIKTLRSDMAILYKSSGKKLKAVLVNADRNLRPLSESFDSFNAD